MWSGARAAGAALALAAAAGCGGGQRATVYDYAATKDCLERHGSLITEPEQGAEVPLPPGMRYEHVFRWSFPLGPPERLFDRGRMVFETSSESARKAGAFILAYSRKEVEKTPGLEARLPDLRLYFHVDHNVLFLWDSGTPTAATMRTLNGCLRSRHG